MGVLIRWSTASNMSFVNNAIYCPDHTAVDAQSIMGATVSTNYLQGRLAGAGIDNTRFSDGGTMDDTFVDPERNDFWPKAGSILTGHADGRAIPEVDFNHTAREAPYDVGAYESKGNSHNPGWNIQEGFKRRN